ncbi:MAG: hypothetical protein QOI59_4203 [Gammaproteobacteria bacterium]|jgi:hypothetical protein|nr:hypothetical protein [Gammaproteobacteria bacterium]
MTTVHRNALAWMAAAGVALAAGITNAATLNVCLDVCTHKTVQGAVDAAASGDVIVVRPGRYVGNITIIGKSLEIIGVNNAPTQVVLIGDGVGPVFTLGANNGGPYFDEFIYFVTVTGGSHFRGTAQGGGVQVRQGANLILLGANVIGNTAAAGGGISINTPGGPTSLINTNCQISSNTAYIGGGVYVAPGSSVDLADECVVSNNTATGNPKLNTAGSGGGVYAEAGSTLVLAQPIITNNSATAPTTCTSGPACDGAGGGVYALGKVTIIGTDITANNVYNPFGAARGGGLYVAANSGQVIGGSVIAHNFVYSSAAPAMGGGIFAFSKDPTVSWTLDQTAVLYNNQGSNDTSAPPSAGGVQNVGKLVLTNGSLITGNFPSQCVGGTGCPAN